MTNDPGKLPHVEAGPQPMAAYVVVGLIVVALVLFAAGVFGGIPDTPRGQLLRVGAALLAAGILLATYLSWQARRPDRLPGIAEDSITYTVGRLAERRDILNSAWVWLLLPLVPGIALLYAGAANAPGVGVTWAVVGLVIVVIAFAIVIAMARRAAAAIDVQIAALGKQR